MTIVNAETKPVGTAAFRSIVSGEPIRRRSLYGQEQRASVQALVVCMDTQAPSPISPDLSVSLVAKVHALKAFAASRIKEALLILEQIQMTPIAIDVELIHKIWLIQRLAVPSELCARIACMAIEDSLSARLIDKIHHEASAGVRTRVMDAAITALDLPNMPRHGHSYYGVLNALMHAE